MRGIIRNSLLKNVLKIFFILLSSWGCSHLSSKEYLPHSLNYFFDDLQMKNYEEMMQILQPILQQTQNTPQDQRPSWAEFADDVSETEYKAYFQTVFLVILSRPPRKGVVQRLIRSIKRRYNLSNDFYSILQPIVQRAITHVKNNGRSPIERATYLYIIENIIQEMRPDVGAHTQVTEILHFIDQARIEIPDSVHRERYIRALEPKTISPSLVARRMIKNFNLKKEIE